MEATDFVFHQCSVWHSIVFPIHVVLVKSNFCKVKFIQKVHFHKFSVTWQLNRKKTHKTVGQIKYLAKSGQWILKYQWTSQFAAARDPCVSWNFVVVLPLTSSGQICGRFWAEWQRSESGIPATQVSVRWGLWRSFSLVPPWLGIRIRSI